MKQRNATNGWWTANRLKALLLVYEDTLMLSEIAPLVGCSERALDHWVAAEPFKARLAELHKKAAEAIERRVAEGEVTGVARRGKSKEHLRERARLLLATKGFPGIEKDFDGDKEDRRWATDFTAKFGLGTQQDVTVIGDDAYAQKAMQAADAAYVEGLSHADYMTAFTQELSKRLGEQ